MRAGKGKKTKRSPVYVFLPVPPRNSLCAPSHHPLLTPLPWSPALFLKSMLPFPALGQFVEEAGKRVSIHFTIAFIQTETGATNLILTVYGTRARDRKRSPAKIFQSSCVHLYATAMNSFTCYLLPQFKYKKFLTFSFMV